MDINTDGSHNLPTWQIKIYQIQKKDICSGKYPNICKYKIKNSACPDTNTFKLQLSFFFPTWKMQTIQDQNLSSPQEQVMIF
jgi:hypothetical protein